MAVTTYAELQTAIANYLKRTDLTSRITEFITFAEDKIILDLKAKGLEKRSTTGTADEYIDLPSGYLDMVNLQINSDPVRHLKFLTPQQMVTKYPNETTGKPFNYTIIGERLQVRPVPDASYTYEMAYKYKLDRLADSNTTNWLLDNYPSVYIYAALGEAEAYMVKDERIATWNRLYGERLDKLILREKEGWKSGSALRMQPDVRIP